MVKHIQIILWQHHFVAFEHKERNQKYKKLTDFIEFYNTKKEL